MLRVDPLSFSEAELVPALEWLRLGRVVAYPTDTFYGLAVDPASDAAVQGLFALKGREATAAIPLIGASTAQVDAWCGLSGVGRQLAAAFWPGPLALICEAPNLVASAVHGGLRTVAIRVPDHPIARALASAWGGPLTATSANRSGAPPARRASELSGVQDDRVLVIDGGTTAGSAPSTIVDARGTAPVLIRAGAIDWERVLHSLQR